MSSQKKLHLAPLTVKQKHYQLESVNYISITVTEGLFIDFPSMFLD